ncbi:MAG: hypothetical protein KIS79_12750 [Burkholderiales bacterium]|nr:hypothetical protein [Burkholderiales bacterium]
MAAIAAVSTAMSVIGAITGAVSQSNAAKYNAAVAQQNATSSRQASALEETRLRVQQRRELGRMHTQIGASGLTMDSFGDFLSNQETEMELDALLVRHGGEMRALGYQNEASLERSRAKSARTGGYISAAGDLVAGGERVYDLMRVG